MTHATIQIDDREYFEPTLRRKGKRYYIRFYDPARTPRQIERALRTSDQRAAQQLFYERRQAYLRRDYDPWTARRREGLTLAEAVVHYLDDPHIRRSTKKTKRNRLEPLARQFPGMMVSGLSADAIRGYCFRTGLRRGTSLRYLCEIRQFLAFCQDRGWVRENPAESILKGLPRHVKREPRQLTEHFSSEEIGRMLTAIDFDIETKPVRACRAFIKDLIRLAVSTGLRRGEICSLRWTDVELFDSPNSGGTDTLYGWISVRGEGSTSTKTGDEDRVPLVALSYSVLLRLKTHGRTEGYVFPGPRGGKLDGEWISAIFREYRRLARLPEHLHFHSLRHTCGSWLAEKGVDIKVIQKVLRHSNIAQTMRYVHLIPKVVAQKMVAGMDGIEI